MIMNLQTYLSALDKSLPDQSRERQIITDRFLQMWVASYATLLNLPECESHNDLNIEPMRLNSTTNRCFSFWREAVRAMVNPVPFVSLRHRRKCLQIQSLFFIIDVWLVHNNRIFRAYKCSNFIALDNSMPWECIQIYFKFSEEINTWTSDQIN